MSIERTPLDEARHIAKMPPDETREPKPDLAAAVERLAAMPKIEFARIRKDEAKRLGVSPISALDEAVVEARKTKQRKGQETGSPAYDIDELAATASEIIASDDVLGLFVNDWRRVIAGEEKNARLLYLVATSRLLKKTMHTAIKGPSSGGKSEIRGHVLNFFPPESIISFTSLSDKALLYMKEPFEHKILSMGEAQDPKEQGFQDYLLRELMSEAKLRYLVAQKIGGEIITTVIEKDGPVVFMVTTTRLKLHPENETRMISIDVDDSETQTRGVLNKVAEVEGLGAPATVVYYAPWHAFQRWIDMGECRVVVPFADVLAENTPPRSVRLRRDFAQVIRAIKAHALIHREHRARDEHGQIVANIENDYTAVRELMHDLLAETSEAKSKATSLETREAVVALTEGLDSDQGVTASAVGRHMKLDKSAASRRLRGAENDGLVVNLENRKGRPGKYRPTDERVEVVQMLPTSEELKNYVSYPSESLATVQPFEITPNETKTCRLHTPSQPSCNPTTESAKGLSNCTTVADPRATAIPIENTDEYRKVAGLQANPGGERCNFSPETVDDLEERLGIMEYDGGMSRTEAEAIAVAEPVDDGQPLPIPSFLRRDGDEQGPGN